MSFFFKYSMIIDTATSCYNLSFWRPFWMKLLCFHVNKNITNDFIDRKNLDVDIKRRLICNA